jgi:hypothetical protein
LNLGGGSGPTGGPIYVFSSSVTIKNNIFNTPYGIYAIGAEGNMTYNGYTNVVVFGPGASIINSSNNNFNVTGAWLSAYGGSSVSSTGDYFGSNGNGVQTFDIGSAFMNALGGGYTGMKVQANAGYYSTPLTMQYMARVNTLASPVSQEPYLSNSSLLRDSYNNPITASQYLSPEESVSILKGLLVNKDSLMPKGGTIGQLSPEMLQRMVRASLDQSVPLPGAQGNREVMEMAMRLANIIANPTDDQKTVIDEATKLLTGMDIIEGQAGVNPELKKATDELLQAVANVLLAQAIPDLLKEGDLSNIKGIFSNLDTAKSRMILEYNESTKPYYDEVKKMIEKNSEALYTSNMLQKNLLDKELKEVPRSEIDRIIEKLKAKSKRTTEEDYILQQEAKYRKTYVEPNKNKLEENMKNMLQDFTKKLSATLETTKK